MVSSEGRHTIPIEDDKPQGVLSEVSPDEMRKTVRDLVPVPGHLFIVGRLDMDSEGLILLTNDGNLANILTHWFNVGCWLMLLPTGPGERRGFGGDEIRRLGATWLRDEPPASQT